MLRENANSQIQGCNFGLQVFTVRVATQVVTFSVVSDRDDIKT